MMWPWKNTREHGACAHGVKQVWLRHTIDITEHGTCSILSHNQHHGALHLRLIDAPSKRHLVFPQKRSDETRGPVDEYVSLCTILASQYTSPTCLDTSQVHLKLFECDLPIWVGIHGSKLLPDVLVNILVATGLSVMWGRRQLCET
jgi:hypothetical protein